MVVIEFRKVKCDNCGEIKEIEGGSSFPSGWLELTIVEWSLSSGTSRWNKDVCGDKCALEIIKKLKKIPSEPFPEVVY